MTGSKIEIENKVKNKVKIPTQAKRGLEWGTRKPDLDPRIRLLNKDAGEGARAKDNCRSLARERARDDKEKSQHPHSSQKRA